MAEIQFNVDAALAKLGEMVATHGQAAVDTAVQVQQINAINSLGGIPGWGLVAYGFYRGARWCYGKVADADYDAEFSYVMGAWVMGGGLIASGIATLSSLFDVWAWVGVFNPKLALAHAILAKFAGL